MAALDGRCLFEAASFPLPPIEQHLDLGPQRNRWKTY
jgi:hypothetical protein